MNDKRKRFCNIFYVTKRLYHYELMLWSEKNQSKLLLHLYVTTLINSICRLHWMLRRITSTYVVTWYWKIDMSSSWKYRYWLWHMGIWITIFMCKNYEYFMHLTLRIVYVYQTFTITYWMDVNMASGQNYGDCSAGCIWVRRYESHQKPIKSIER